MDEKGGGAAGERKEGKRELTTADAEEKCDVEEGVTRYDELMI